jgi:hypothetical protein
VSNSEVLLHLAQAYRTIPANEASSAFFDMAYTLMTGETHVLSMQAHTFYTKDNPA